MPAFRDTQHAADVLGGFFKHEAATDTTGMFAGSGVVIAYKLTDPDVRVVLDASQAPAPNAGFRVWVNDPGAPEPQVEFLLDADTFDKLYLGEAQPMVLMMTGKVKAKGDVTAAMKLLPAMARAIPHYKEYRKTH
jgi:hypothetical protein